MNGLVGGWVGGWVGGRTDLREPQIEQNKDLLLAPISFLFPRAQDLCDGWVGGWAGGWVIQMSVFVSGRDGWVGGWVGRFTFPAVDGELDLVHRYVGKSLSGWVGGWVDGWMDEQCVVHIDTDPPTHPPTHPPTYLFVRLGLHCPMERGGARSHHPTPFLG